MLSIGPANVFGSFGQFSTPTAEEVRLLQGNINTWITDPLNRVTVNGQLTSETIGQIPIVARRAIDRLLENGQKVDPILNRAATNQLTAEVLAFEAGTVNALGAALAEAEVSTTGQQVQPDQVQRDADFIKEIETSVEREQIDPADRQVVQESAQESVQEVQRDADFITEVEPSLVREATSDPVVARDIVTAVNNAVAQAKAQGKSVPEQKAAGKEAAKQTIITAAKKKKKFFDVKNPMMWVAIGGGVVGVIIIGALIKGAAGPAPVAATAATAPSAIGRRRRQARRPPTRRPARRR